MDIKWEDPPEPTGGNGNGKVARFVEALKERPGQWALYSEDVSSSMVSLNKRRFPGTDWVSRTVDGKRRIYGRWVGLDGEHAD